MKHDEIAERAFHTILACRDQGITDPLRTAHAIAVAVKLAEEPRCPTCDALMYRRPGDYKCPECRTTAGWKR